MYITSIAKPISFNRALSTITRGSKYTSNYKKYLKLDSGKVGSFFHDVPLSLNTEAKTCKMVTEVPRWSNAKFEISKEIDFNPIVQDTKNGKVRFVNNIFPYHGYIHNYGALPQTWEDPTQTSKLVNNLVGDNDPLDCCEIGSQILDTGSIRTVKILGSLALIDDGELDWKVITLNVGDPVSEHVNNLKDIEKVFPGLLHATREWFRVYKIPTGKSANKFALGGQYQDADTTIKMIQECNEAWKQLVQNKKSFSDVEKLPKTLNSATDFELVDQIERDYPVPSSVNNWDYVRTD